MSGLLVLYLFFSQPIGAVVSLPEYSYVGEPEARDVNGPRTIGSEFQSDVLAFTKPFLFESQFIRAEKVFDLTVGSLGPTRFLTNNRLKLQQSLLTDLEFKLISVDQGDFEQEVRATVFEFSYSFGQVAVAAYGEIATRKSEDDIGFAVIGNLSDHHRLRFFVTWVDFSFNQRNEQDESYRQQPIVYGLVGRYYEFSQDYLEYSIRWEPRSQRVDAAEGQEYLYGNVVGNIHGRLALSEASSTYLNFDGSWRQRFEQRLVGSPPASEAWDGEHLDFLVQREDRVWIHGLKMTYRHWQREGGGVIHNDLLPHFWYKAFRRDYGQVESHWNFGYEFTWHRGQGPTALRATLDRDNVLEHRANVRYDLRFSAQAWLNLLLSFDLDEFGGGETWEGGNAQFQWLF